MIELQNDGGGLAFGIIGGRSTGVVVKTILPGGVADRVNIKLILDKYRNHENLFQILKTFSILNSDSFFS